MHNFNTVYGNATIGRQWRGKSMRKKMGTRPAIWMWFQLLNTHPWLGVMSLLVCSWFSHHVGFLEYKLRAICFKIHVMWPLNIGLGQPVLHGFEIQKICELFQMITTVNYVKHFHVSMEIVFRYT